MGQERMVRRGRRDRGRRDRGRRDRGRRDRGRRDRGRRDRGRRDRGRIAAGRIAAGGVHALASESACWALSPESARQDVTTLHGIDLTNYRPLHDVSLSARAQGRARCVRPRCARLPEHRTPPADADTIVRGATPSLQPLPAMPVAPGHAYMHSRTRPPRARDLAVAVASARRASHLTALPSFRVTCT